MDTLPITALQRQRYLALIREYRTRQRKCATKAVFREEIMKLIFELHPECRAHTSEFYQKIAHDVPERFVAPLVTLCAFHGSGSPSHDKRPQFPVRFDVPRRPTPQQFSRRRVPQVSDSTYYVHIDQRIPFVISGSTEPGVRLVDLLNKNPCTWMQGHQDSPFLRSPFDQILFRFSVSCDARSPIVGLLTASISGLAATSLKRRSPRPITRARPSAKKGHAVHLRRSSLAKAIAQYIAKVLPQIAHFQETPDTNFVLSTTCRKGITIEDIVLVSLVPISQQPDCPPKWIAELDVLFITQPGTVRHEVPKSPLTPIPKLRPPPPMSGSG
ncbi:hypothetical protein EW146_g119 [Bondarzewia mesenterica]|uniref:Uncharacterized protein n=1 Tax=Bondarzewia mesenterica TaxID=1095465 RepID=A0A4S4M828_9AGAM|nr:hypothetical protein EW146_g119 [Bondarzewia mesenterica]